MFYCRETLKYVLKEMCTNVLCSSVYNGQKSEIGPLSITRTDSVSYTYQMKYYTSVEMTARATGVSMDSSYKPH